MSTAFHQCEYQHDTSVHLLSWTASHSKDSDMVFCCCVHDVYVSVSCRNDWNFCYTVNTCMVSLHCEFCCVQQDLQPVWIVCYKHYIQTVSLQNDFVCVLLGLYYSDNIGHIRCICIYQCEYSCDNSVCCVMKNFSHIHCMNTCFLQCVFVCVYWNVLSA